jgi:hypothetical protein
MSKCNTFKSIAYGVALLAFGTSSAMATNICVNPVTGLVGGSNCNTNVCPQCQAQDSISYNNPNCIPNGQQNDGLALPVYEGPVCETVAWVTAQIKTVCGPAPNCVVSATPAATPACYSQPSGQVYGYDTWNITCGTIHVTILPGATAR